jgi:foldase protein PrsA
MWRYDGPAVYALARCVSAIATLLLLAAGLGACGSSTPGGAVASVNGTPIAKNTVEHWMSVMAGRQVTSVDAPQDRELRQRALDFLISSQWTLGEAGKLGVKVSAGEAEHQLEVLSYAEHEGEHYEVLPKQGEIPVLFAKGDLTHADRVWLMQLALLESKSEQGQLARARRQLTRAQIAGYYEQNKTSFVVPEKRNVEWIVTYGAASLAAAVHEIRSGKSFVSVAHRVSLDPPTITGMEYATEREKDFARNVFDAKPHVIEGPFLQHRNHYVLEVTGVTPSRQLTLAESESSIRQRLAFQWVSAGLPAIVEREWVSRTNCRSGYVIPKCGRSTGGSV